MGLAPAPGHPGPGKQLREWMNGFIHSDAGSWCAHHWCQCFHFGRFLCCCRISISIQLLKYLRIHTHIGHSVLSPCFRVDVVSVHVVHQAVFVVAECLVSPVDKHTAAGLVVHAAVAITSLNHRTPGRHNLPRVRPWNTERRALINAVQLCRKIKVDDLKSFWMLWQVLLFAFVPKMAEHFQFWRWDRAGRREKKRGSQTLREARGY